MRLLFKLLATLAFTSLLLAKVVAAQGFPPLVIDQIAFESNAMTKPDIEQLTMQLKGRSCSGEEVRSQTMPPCRI